MISVVTFLWSDPAYRYNKLFTYGKAHVQKFFRGIDANLTIPHENVLITDDVNAFAPIDIGADRILPLWQEFRGFGGCYTRLHAFAPNMREFIGPRFAWLDLDCVITGNLDHIFSRTEDFIAWRNVHTRQPYCGSLIMMNAGARPHVYTRAQKELAQHVKAPGQWFMPGRFIGTDQAFIAHCLGRNEATITSALDGVYNYTHEIKAHHAGKLPVDARIVFFTGPADPSQKQNYGASPWIERYWR
jgi:hypothetical protein